MMDLDRRTYFDFSIFFTVLALWVIGIFLIYSATRTQETGPLVGIAKSQIVWVAMGVLIILAVVSIPASFYYHAAYVFYVFSLLFLIFVIFTGNVSKGAVRWVAVGGVKIQPSEFAKIGLLLALARYFSSKTVNLEKISTFIVPSLLILVPFALVLKQPDLGTAMVFCAMSLPMFYWAGLTLGQIFLLVSPGVSLALSAIPLIMAFGTHQTMGIGGAIPWGVFFVVLFAFLYLTRPPLLILVGTLVVNLFTAGITTLLWALLKDYQKTRIISFINPQADPFGAGYQVIQSMVAIGSGHIVGKGYLQGTQTRLSFLPEQHTDFIFSVLGEQFGFLGCVGIVALFLFLIFKGYFTTRECRSRFSNLLVVGAVSIIAFHVFVNVAMTLGMMPVTGIPLPFLSYGGSFAFTVAILAGFILNARVGGKDF